MKFKVALLQIASEPAEDKNLRKGLQWCRDAKHAGADLVVFPELWSRQRPIDAGDGGVHALRDLAAELHLNIAITYLERYDPKPRNSVSVFNDQGELALHYSKFCICDFPADGESGAGCDSGYSAGDSFDVCTLRGSEGEVRVGALICADREIPEPATRLMMNGAELIIVPNACDWDDLRSSGLLTRAFENMVGVAMTNYPRPLANGNSRAYTCVAWENGKPKDPLIAAAGEEETLLVVDVDIDAIRRFRRAEEWRLQHRYRSASLQ